MLNKAVLMMTAAVIPFAIAVPASAQTGDTEAVTVTGTLIAGDTTSPLPLTVITSDAIENAGTSDISDVLRKEPAFGSNTRGASFSLNGSGSQGLDLRNLGTLRTLVLIDGHRDSIFTDEVGNVTTDVGMIPTAMIESVDVLRDGAGPTYGADAVSGVVNFKLRDHFDGIQLGGYTGGSSHNDGFADRFSAILGFSGDKGSIVLSAEYQDQDPIQQSRRTWATNLVTTLNSTVAYNSPITPGGTVLSTAGATIACYPNAGGANVAPNCPRYDASAESSLILGGKLKSFGAVGTYDVTSDIHLRAEGFYSERNTEQNISAVQLDTTTAIGPYSNITIPATSSNNPYGQAVRIRWRLSDYGPATNFDDNQQLWLNFGLFGKVFGDYDWTLNHVYSSTVSLSQRINIPNIDNLNLLLSPTGCSADPICAGVGAIPNIANLLSQTTPLTTAQRNYLFFATTINSRFVTQQDTAGISGPLFNLPAGVVKAALGFEHREESGVVSPDSVTQTTATGRSIVFPTNGSFSTNEVYAEAHLPLLKDAPLAESLDIDLQGRYSNFSNFGGAETYKVGLDYQPVDDVRFRAAWGTSFRAPNVLELYGGGVGSQSSGVTDPCNAGGARATNATVAANCAAAGVPAGYTQATSAVPIRGGGNPTLQPEHGRSFSVGTVLTPSFVPGLSASIDYYNDKVTNGIGTGNLTNNLLACYSDPSFLTRAANPNDVCYGYNARSGGALLRLNNPSSNANIFSTYGIDLSADYAVPGLPIPGDVTLSTAITRVLGYYSTSSGEVVGKFVNGVNGNLAYPKWSGTFGADYTIDDFGFQWTVVFVDAMSDSVAGTATLPLTNPLDYSGTPAYFSHDVLFRWKALESLDLNFGVNNLFDKDPPFAFVSTRNTLPSVYDQVGRYMFLSAKLKM